MTAPAFLAEWLEGSSGHLAERTFVCSPPTPSDISRTIRMAEARNKALAGFGDESLDWLVVIDADLYANFKTHFAVD